MKLPALVIVATLAVLLAFSAGCSSFPFGGVGAPHGPGPSTSLPSSPGSKWEWGQWVGIFLTIGGLLLAALTEMWRRGLTVSFVGVLTWVLSSFLEKFETPILFGTGFVLLAVVAYTLYEAWKNRAGLLRQVKNGLSDPTGSTSTGGGP